MSESGSDRTVHATPRVPAHDDSAIDPDDASPARQPQLVAQSRRPSGRVSFSSILPRRPSFVSRWRHSTVDEESGGLDSPKPDPPPIPSALQPAAEVNATPLPTLSMIVLSICMLGEFLSANVSAPFLLFMVEGFGQFKNDADVGYWTGILVSTFFLTQFLTSLLWATVAAKHGQRLVIIISLLGSAVTCSLFGTSKSIEQAIVIRLMQGVFAGAIGVARGSVTGITDPSNEGRAYAILGFCWGLGGVSGAIVGGMFENPAKKWPEPFSHISLFVEYPYLLPCLVASSVTLLGSILCLFLGRDCGPREGAIRLPIEKYNTHSTIAEESPPISPIDEQEVQPRGLLRKVSKKLSSVFSRQNLDTSGIVSPSSSVPVHLATAPTRNRSMSQPSRMGGSAYGYSGAYRSRLASSGNLAQSLAVRRGSTAGFSARNRRGSNTNVNGAEPPVSSSFATGSDLNFAQRLLMANENTVTNIADLWVAAAMNVDNEDPFEAESEYDYDGDNDNAVAATQSLEDLSEVDMLSSPNPRSNRFSRRLSAGSPSVRNFRSGANLVGQRHHSSSQHRESPATGRRFSNATANITPSLASGMDAFSSIHTGRRFSNTVPSIFSHVGVRTPPAVVEAQQLLALADEAEAAGADTLSPIIEGQRAISPVPTDVPLQEPSLMSQLPILIIIQYGLLALHSTTHDQVFYLYLVSKYPTGGLNLNAGHFSQLIALMCLAQIVYQFYLYPNIGPPRGRFSHLAMFRIGSLLYVPAYLSVILYRVFASANDEGSVVLMGALAISTAIRYCGITFSYTAISVLLNYMSPPHVVGYANGIAQSIVSLARFFGPVLGGTLWSMSVQNGPSGYPLGFIVCSAVCALAVAQSFWIR